MKGNDANLIRGPIKFKEFQYENRIGPMVCLFVTKIFSPVQRHSMKFYKIYFPGAMLGAAQLHAFKVIRDGNELYLPTHTLKSGDNVWVDRSAFLADGSLILEKGTINE